MNGPTLAWRQTTEADQPKAAIADHVGQIFICGGTSAPAEQGHKNGFLAKYDNKGNQIWRKTTETAEYDFYIDIALDYFGQVFICGVTSAPTEQGLTDSFMAKYDTNGNLIWRKAIETSAHDDAAGIATDQSGFVFICGRTLTQLGQRTTAAFLTKYDTNGNLIWRKATKTAEYDDATSIATDQLGDVFICGRTSAHAGQRTSDAFLAKYDTEGNQIWRNTIKTSEYNSALAIATNHLGHVFICGYTSVAAEQGWADAFLSKYDTKGNLIWHKTTKTEEYDFYLDIATDNLGHVFVFGQFSHSVKQGYTDGFVTKYDEAGNQIWRKTSETAHYDREAAIVTDHLGHVIICGTSSASHNRGQTDGFLAKYADDLSPSHKLLLLENRFHKLESRMENQFAQLTQSISQLHQNQLPLDLDLALIQTANKQTRGQGDTLLTELGATEIIEQARDVEGIISEIGKKTIAFIFARYMLTREAKEVLVLALA